MNSYTEQTQNTARTLLTEEGYMPGEYNPHNVRAWVLTGAYGVHGVVLAAHGTDALDEAVDQGMLDSEMMSPEDHAEYEANGWDDSYVLAGNPSEPFWSENLRITEVEIN